MGRIKIIWDEEGIENYEYLIGNSLAGLRQRWGNSSCRSSISLLLSSTNSFLSFAARSSNKSIDLSTTRRKKPNICPIILRNEKAVLKCKKSLNHTRAIPLSLHNLVSPISGLPTHLYQAHIYWAHLYQTSFIPCPKISCSGEPRGISKGVQTGIDSLSWFLPSAKIIRPLFYCSRTPW